MERGFDRMMLFRDIPDSVVQAERAAPAMAATLLEYKRFGIEPLVIFEPQGLDVNNIDPAIFTAYFKALVAHGVPPDAIGTWSLFPEPNLPLWSTDSDLGNTDRVAFGRNLENSAQALKQSFPQAKVMLLLDSATYASHDVDYAHKRPPETMLEYTNIQPGLVDEFCIQGFPWTNEARAKDFVSADLALAAAKKLGGPQKVKVSFNTGTFSQVAAPISGATATAAQREQNLNGILEQAKIVQQNGFAVAVNIFGADKMPDEANWSYVGGPSTEKLKAFIQAAARAGIRLSIFDE